MAATYLGDFGNEEKEHDVQQISRYNFKSVSDEEEGLESDDGDNIIEATQINESAARKSIGLGNGSNRKGKGKPGRKARWTDGCTDDLVDIICNNEVYKKRIIFTHIKTSKNGSYCEKSTKELKQRCTRRGRNFPLRYQSNNEKIQTSCC